MKYLSLTGKGLPVFLQNVPAVFMETKVEGFYAYITVLRCLVVLLEGDHRAGTVRLNLNIINLNFSSRSATKENLLIDLPFLGCLFFSLEVGMITARVG